MILLEFVKEFYVGIYFLFFRDILFDFSYKVLGLRRVGIRLRMLVFFFLSFVRILCSFEKKNKKYLYFLSICIIYKIKLLYRDGYLYVVL